MNCKKVRHLIQLDLDGDLPPDRRTALDAHLAACEDCRGVRQQLGAVLTATRQSAGPEKADACAMDFAPYRSGSWRMGLAAAAAIALLVGGYVAVRTAQSPGEPSAPPRIAEAPPAQPRPCSDGAEVSPMAAGNQATSTDLRAATRPDAGSLVQVTFPEEEELIVVPIETQNPNVTIMWVYPTIRTAKAPVEPSDEPPPSS